MTNVEALKALYVALGGDADDVANVSTIVGVLNAISAKYEGEDDATLNPEAIANITAVVDNMIPDPTLIEKTITANGEYAASADDADGYSKVIANVQPNLTTKSITANGTYNAISDNADGYSSVTVNVTPIVEAESEEPSEAQSGDYVWIGYSLTGSDVTLIIRVTQDDTPPSESDVTFVTSVIIN